MHKWTVIVNTKVAQDEILNALPEVPRTWTRFGSSGGVNVGAVGWSSAKLFIMFMECFTRRKFLVVSKTMVEEGGNLWKSKKIRYFAYFQQ